MNKKKKKKIAKECDTIYRIVRKNLSNEANYGFNSNPSRNKEFANVCNSLNNIREMLNINNDNK